MKKSAVPAAFAPRTVIVGAGRVAWHLAHRLAERGVPLAQILSRSEASARRLAEAIGAAYSIDFQEIERGAACYFLAVNDDALPSVAGILASQNIGDGLVAHTSGATPGVVLAEHFARWGVFWPLQSFSLATQPHWSRVPICLHAGSEPDLRFLETMVRCVGAKSYRVDDAQRGHLHVAAVFANNFANHCFAVAEQILAEKGLPFDLLHPIMRETLAKALADSPAKMQTGPAIRGDEVTMRRQLLLLENHPRWQAIYQSISESIAVGGGRLTADG